jgi:hypothetical protein
MSRNSAAQEDLRFCRELLQSKKQVLPGEQRKNETFGIEEIEWVVHIDMPLYLELQGS